MHRIRGGPKVRRVLHGNFENLNRSVFPQIDSFRESSRDTSPLYEGLFKLAKARFGTVDVKCWREGVNQSMAFLIRSQQPQCHSPRRGIDVQNPTVEPHIVLRVQ